MPPSGLPSRRERTVVGPESQATGPATASFGQNSKENPGLALFRRLLHVRRFGGGVDCFMPDIPEQRAVAQELAQAAPGGDAALVEQQNLGRVAIGLEPVRNRE